MDLITNILIAVGLAMDAFAVSIAIGLNLNENRMKNAIKIGLFFGFFQFIMPIIGWVLGTNFSSLISGFDHYIAFILLAFIGIKMIIEGFNGDESCIILPDFKKLIILSIATSIDALAVGLSYAFLNVSIVTPSIIIGVITFILSFIGANMGCSIGKKCKSKMIDIIGGTILIGIGLKILIQHLIS
jgi:putative Mn2+ efflux pump MntP